MKSQKTNAFQLAIAGAVLVLVLACSTFAWIAIVNSADVRGIFATLGAHAAPNQVNYIKYSEDGENWLTYDGQNLELEPGKQWRFEVGFTADDDAVMKMYLDNFSSTLRLPTDEDDGEQGEAATLSAEGDAVDLKNVLMYRMNPSDKSPYLPLTFDENGGSALIWGPANPDTSFKKDGQYVYRYDLKLSEEAGSEYEGLTLSFDLLIPFNQTVEEN